MVNCVSCVRLYLLYLNMYMYIISILICIDSKESWHSIETRDMREREREREERERERERERIVRERERERKRERKKEREKKREREKERERKREKQFQVFMCFEKKNERHEQNKAT